MHRHVNISVVTLIPKKDMLDTQTSEVLAHRLHDVTREVVNQYGLIVERHIADNIIFEMGLMVELTSPLGV